MVHFLIGSAGSGKSEYIASSILDDLRHDIPVLLLVPEQMAIRAERHIADLIDQSEAPIRSDRLEILNFTRLANRVFRTLGGISYRPIGKGTRALIMWQTLLSCAPHLTEYQPSALSPEAAAPMMLSAIKETTIYGVTPAKLEEASRLLADMPTLSNKLKDLSLIASTYKAYLTERYDDPSEQLPRLTRVLESHPIFSDYHIYFDAYYGLTAQEYDLVEALMRQGANVTFAICLSKSQSDAPAFAPAHRMYRRLSRMAKESETTYLDSAYRFQNEALATLSRSLFAQTGDAPFPPARDAIRVFACRTDYDMAEQVAMDIARRVREEGCRYRDFAIVAGDSEQYAGIMDSYLRRYEIPCFLSKRTDLTHMPAVKLILSLLALKQFGFRASDMTDLIRTGLTPLDDDTADLLCAYIDTWELSGQAYSESEEWTNHPRGYLAEFKEADLCVLARANEAKDRILPAIHVFAEVFAPDATVKTICRALYGFLVDFGVRESMARRDPRRAALIWNTVMRALDEMVDALGEGHVDAEGFRALFTMVIREMDIGALPQTADEVVIGTAALLRAENVRHVYLIGVNEGVFPVCPSEGSVFSDSDKIALEGIGMPLSATLSQGIEEGLFHFWRALSSASASVSILYALSSPRGEKKKPSALVTRILGMYEGMTLIYPAELPLIERLQSKRADFIRLARMRPGPLKRALSDYYKEDPRMGARLASLAIPISDPRATLKKDVATLLYPGNMTMSQSRFEDFVHCPFAYHCKHVLHLEESKPALIRPTDTGKFIHHILERFFRAIRGESGIKTDLSEDEIAQTVDAIIADYLDGVFRDAGSKRPRSARILALFRRLRRLTLPVIRDLLEEFKSSSFVPTFFEMPLSYAQEENAVFPLSISLSDGKSVSIIGRIDRVDTYKRGKDVYVRVVDYKTGAKAFALKDLEIGLNMQMLLYLFSVWHRASPALRAQMGVKKDGEIIPAGVLICPAKPGHVTLNHKPCADEVEAELRATLTRSGLLLNDEEILSAMDHTEGMRYLPISFNKDGSISRYTLQAGTLQSLSDFGKRLNEVTEKVREITESIKIGLAEARPLKDKSRKIDACTYCAMKPVCRSFKAKAGSQEAETKGGDGE